MVLWGATVLEEVAEKDQSQVQVNLEVEDNIPGQMLLGKEDHTGLPLTGK